MIKQELQELIAQKKACIGVIGLGYVGLPLVVEFARNGFSGIGFEVDQRKADEINAGRSYIPDVPSDHVAESVAADRLQATTDFAHLNTCDVIIICVPTPLRKTKDPDMSYILAAAEKIQENLRRGQLIILESTTYPGTTDEVLLPMFEEKGFKLDEDFLLAFSPERVDPGNPQFLTHNITKVVGGVTEDSTEVSAELYRAIVENVHPVTSARVAEAAKLWENTFRAVNIGMANEMAKLCQTLGIDTWEVVRAAATKPFGFMAFYPGPGIGGHCLVGSETVVVHSGKTESVKSLEQLFTEEAAKPSARTFNADGADVVYQPNLQALSLNPSTQLPEWKPVSYIFRRQIKTKLVTVTTSDNRKLTTTDKHPFLVADELGNVREVFAADLQVGHRLPINVAPAPISGGLLNETISDKIDLLPLLPFEIQAKIRVRLVEGNWKDYRTQLKHLLPAEKVWELTRQNYLPLSDFLALEKSGLLDILHDNLRLYTGRGTSAASFPAVIKLTPEFARLIGYYLAEGCTTCERGRERVRFSFHRDEIEFINDVRHILENELGVKTSLHHSKIDKVTHIRVASSIFGYVLTRILNCGRRSTEMQMPDVLFSASATHRYELLKGLLRGDGDVYVKTGVQRYERNGKTYQHRNATAEVGYFSSSPRLFQQVIYLLQNFGFTPTFKRTKPHLGLKGREQILRAQALLGEKGAKLSNYFAANQRITASKTFKHAGLLTTVPVKSIDIFEPEVPTEVYSLEVEDNHTFAASYGIFVHNCIPLDPHYLSWKARQHGFDSRFISLAEEVNSSMPQHVFNLVRDALNDDGKAVKNSKILILGVAYKKDIDDMRESPALSIIDLLRAKGATVEYHDPFVPEVTFDHSHTLGHGEPLYNVELTDERMQNADCVVIVTEHSTVDYKQVCEKSRLIVDTRNALSTETRGGSKAKVVRL
jgi:UDP-N-acetyl-D-mannosaminuronate dehydrogenase/intein/homing endonuclease